MKRSIKKLVRSASHKISPTLSNMLFSAKDFRGFFGFTPNFFNPKTFNQKFTAKSFLKMIPASLNLPTKFVLKIM